MPSLSLPSGADEITCVDSSRSRLAKLRDVIGWYVPGAFNEDAEHGHPIKLMNEDGQLLGNIHPNRYDKVGRKR